MPARYYLAAAVLFGSVPALAAKPLLQTVYEFTAIGGDGAVPEATPAYGSGSALYGTTVVGGTADRGMVYQLDAKTGAETPVYGFKGGAGDGAQPQAGVTVVGHFLYGTTYEGGIGKGVHCKSMGCGTVYRIDTSSGAETLLHSFGGHGDGEIPSGGKLIYSGGLLYGSTEYGGSAGRGTVYSADPSSGATVVLYSFQGGMDGKRPQGGLLAVGGVLVGTTFEGGGHGCKYACGTLFSVDPATGAEAVLHAFTGFKDKRHKDGEYPFGDLSANGSVIYGTTTTGGKSGHGTVYQFDMAASVETVLHDFENIGDGAAPGGVTYDNGVLYGGTLVGGTYGYGVEYRLNPATRREVVFHTFTGGTDGGLAYGAPVAGAGVLYGTTYQGGNLNDCPGMGCGTIFVVTP